MRSNTRFGQMKENCWELEKKASKRPSKWVSRKNETEGGNAAVEIVLCSIEAGLGNFVNVTLKSVGA